MVVKRGLGGPPRRVQVGFRHLRSRSDLDLRTLDEAIQFDIVTQRPDEEEEDVDSDIRSG